MEKYDKINKTVIISVTSTCKNPLTHPEYLTRHGANGCAFEKCKR